MSGLAPHPPSDRHRQLRWAVILSLVLLSGLSHWIVPISEGWLHIVHLFFRKAFVVPIVLAAIWFELRGAVLASVLVTLFYAPHVLLQWPGQSAENMNQAGEVLTLWAIAGLSGMLVRAEKRALREVAETHEGSLVALVSALDAREHETGSHSLRVRACSLRLADELGLDERERAVLGQAALLHDVGKIGTPDEILLKPGPLDDEQWRIIREHPDAGFTIVNSVPFLRRAAEVIRCHHERYDGSGYPRAWPASPSRCRPASSRSSMPSTRSRRRGRTGRR